MGLLMQLVNRLNRLGRYQAILSGPLSNTIDILTLYYNSSLLQGWVPTRLNTS